MSSPCAVEKIWAAKNSGAIRAAKACNRVTRRNNLGLSRAMRKIGPPAIWPRKSPSSKGAAGAIRWRCATRSGWSAAKRNARNAPNENPISVTGCVPNCARICGSRGPSRRLGAKSRDGAPQMSGTSSGDPGRPCRYTSGDCALVKLGRSKSARGRWPFPGPDSPYRRPHRAACPQLQARA